MCKAEHFNRKAASSKSKPGEILKALNIKPGQKIADVGSGGGYFTLRFAQAAGTNGQVYAADTNQEYLDHIRAGALKQQLNNIIPANISEGLEVLPDKFFDLIFLRNVYHHLSDRSRLMSNYKKKLSPAGKIAIVEYKPGFSIFSFRKLFGHNVPKKTIMAEMQQAGYRKVEEYTFLPEQSFTVYKIC